MRDVVTRLAKAGKRLAAPRSRKTSSVGPAAVTLKWTAPKGATPAYYVVFRDGKSLGKTARKSCTDSKVKAGQGVPLHGARLTIETLVRGDGLTGRRLFK